jgi:hypothetical protein
LFLDKNIAWFDVYPDTQIAWFGRFERFGDRRFGGLEGGEVWPGITIGHIGAFSNPLYKPQTIKPR